MTYVDWNNHIANLFFKSENAGKNILFYLTQQDLIKHARPLFSTRSDEEIWMDFINAIKYGEQEPGDSRIQYSPVERPIELYTNWNGTDTPPFIAYLILYIIPLTETYERDFRANNYYGKVTEFFKRHGIIEPTEKIWIGNFSTLSHLYNKLEEWSVMTKNCDLGFFELKKFGNKNWIHVGKPFSQCVLPPSAINKLPELFFEAGLIPDSAYSKEELKKILLKYGSKILWLKESVLELIKKSDTNELGQSIIEIVNREYKKWTGETHDVEGGGLPQRIKRNYTVASLFLQFRVNDNDGGIRFSFRVHSSNDYPEDLKFAEYDNLYEKNGWSKTLNLEFKESFELKDDFNKWVARFPDRDVRLFVSAGTYQLSTGYWIETESLSKTDAMYLLCKNEKRDSILEWGKSFRSGDFRKEDFEGLPEQYSLYKILNPVLSHPSIPLLTIYTEKRIELVGGLKVNFRTFINDFLPEVEITNSDGNEKVYLQYRNTEEKVFLGRKQSNRNRWFLPPDTLLNVDFYIRVEGENLASNEVAYNLTSSFGTARKVDGNQLPKRDSFGRHITDEPKQYCLGSNLINPDLRSKKGFSPYTHLFTSINQEIAHQISKVVVSNHGGNMLCSFLSLKNVLTTEEFFRAFEFYYSKVFSERQATASFNLTRTKNAALNFYDYTGILDYDYESKRIVLNPPQFIFIPASQGRKMLLIGARDLSLVEEVVNIAPKHNLQVEITKQFSSNEELLLPDAISIRAFGKSNENFGEKNLITFSKELQIEFSNDYFPQVALQEFSSGIAEYGRSKQQTDENDYGWARRIFNPDDLSFERSETQTFDKSFSMIEYKLNEYTYYYKLWEDGKCYQVDKNWGKYLALKRFNKNVILFDSSRDRVAIPWETPLPRLLSESIMLLSGLAPDFREIEGRNYRVYENIPGILTKNLFYKLSQQPINKELK
ncbi:MAG: hypothetical protein JNL17_07625 [Cyclobacteriaceae bacterium]|nr:hypothetical protein [Cyclobacteriaceae bacterium]